MMFLFYYVYKKFIKKFFFYDDHMIAIYDINQYKKNNTIIEAKPKAVSEIISTQYTKVMKHRDCKLKSRKINQNIYIY